MILCCGEALIDMLPRQMENSNPVYLPVPGGAIFNTAIALGRLEEPASFFSGLSSDLFGERLVATLAASNVGIEQAIRSSKLTTLAFVELKDGHANYTFYDEASAGRMITAKDLPEFRDVEAAHFGAISLIGEPCGSAYEEVAMRLKDRSVISLDPNIRPQFITDETAYRERLERLFSIADIIKVSDEDLHWLAQKRPVSKLFDQWLSQGAALVVHTKGDEGVAAITPAGSITQSAIPVEVVDTVGAGDSFNAGLLSGLRQQGLLNKAALINMKTNLLKNALLRAVTVAAHTVSRTGADAPTLSEISN